MEFTPNYNLKKPAEEDFYNVEDFNDNADIIDEELHNKVNKSEYTANDVLDKLKTVDGTGSGLDADTVDGIQGTDLVKKDGSVPMDDLTIGTRKTGSVVGTNSFTQGFNCEASGNYSHAEGYNSTASGKISHAGGYYTIAQGHSQTAIGRYNKAQGTGTSIVATDDAFIIGNGTSSSARSNAFRVTFDGKAYGLSAYNSSGADYAEYFEWEDGNLDCEDRVGYFVTLDGEKIRKANSTDDYILGVVSANATVIGDTASENWHKKYITDEFGRVQYEYIDVPAVIDDEGNEIEPARQDYVPKINPEWDNTLEYIPREQRPEWSAIGMMGKLLVYDDGTCQINGYCKPNDNGIATNSTAGYRVMKRVSENIIQILLK